MNCERIWIKLDQVWTQWLVRYQYNLNSNVVWSANENSLNEYDDNYGDGNGDGDGGDCDGDGDGDNSDDNNNSNNNNDDVDNYNCRDNDNDNHDDDDNTDDNTNDDADNDEDDNADNNISTVYTTPYYFVKVQKAQPQYLLCLEAMGHSWDFWERTFPTPRPTLFSL